MIYMDNKAQGAVEYLLLLAGAVIVAAAVLAFMVYMTPTTRDVANNKLTNFLHII